MRSSLSFAFALGIGNVLASKASPHYYLPVDFFFGADSRITANIVFGTAPSAQPVKVVVDNASPYTWVWSPNAVITYGSLFTGITGICNASVPDFYDPALSRTSSVINRNSSFAYAGNSKKTFGTEFANDTLIPVGGNNPIPNVQFALENFGILRVYDNGSCSTVPSYDQSILGLSYYNPNNTAGPSFVENLFQTGNVASKTAFLWFDKHEGALGNLTGGLLFGAIDKSKYTGPLVEVGINSQEYDGFVYTAKPNITVSGQTFVPDKNTICLLDSGTHADYIPYEEGNGLDDRFYNATGNRLVDYYGTVGFNGTCDSIPQDFNITYTFGGVRGGAVDIAVPLRNYARMSHSTYEDTGLCLLNLKWSGDCIFGATFHSAAALLLDGDGNRAALAQGAISREREGIKSDSLHVFEGLKDSAHFWASL